MVAAACSSSSAGGTGGAGGGAVDSGTDLIDVTGAPDAGGGDTGACVTSFGSASRLLFAFDNGLTTDWAANVTGIGYTLGSSTTEGHACPGAITLSLQYTAYGNANNDVAYPYVTPADWSGFGKVHAWVKLVTTTYSALAGVQAFVQSDNGTSYANGGYVNGIDFSNGAFHEVVFDMLQPNFVSSPIAFGAINRVGIQIQVQASAPDGGPAAPADVQMIVDDVWLERAPADAGSD